MRNAIILHGKPGREEYYDPDVPSASNFHWLAWLQKQLLIRDVAAQTPEVPNAWRPDYATWRTEFERYDITPETILVGHSCGGGFIVRWLSDHPDVTVGPTVLVAPWFDVDREHTTDFFDFTIDPGIVDRTAKLVAFSSDDDDASDHRHVDLLLAAAPSIRHRRFSGYGHFCVGDIGAEFPELLEELLH